MNFTYTLAIGMPGPFEWTVILIVGLLIFGRRLPEVGKNVGKSIIEFKKGLKGIENDLDVTSNPQQQTDQPPTSIQQNTPTAPETVQTEETEKTKEAAQA